MTNYATASCDAAATFSPVWFFRLLGNQARAEHRLRVSATTGPSVARTRFRSLGVLEHGVLLHEVISQRHALPTDRGVGTK
jgi:hypothetical protein